MKDLVETIVKAIVDKPEAVNVTQTSASDITDVISVKVDQNDLGKVIGKKGNTAYCIRNLIFAASFRTKKRYTVNITALEDK